MTLRDLKVLIESWVLGSGLGLASPSLAPLTLLRTHLERLPVRRGWVKPPLLVIHLHYPPLSHLRVFSAGNIIHKHKHKHRTLYNCTESKRFLNNPSNISRFQTQKSFTKLILNWHFQILIIISSFKLVSQSRGIRFWCHHRPTKISKEKFTNVRSEDVV